MDWVQGQLSRDSVAICNNQVLQEICVSTKKDDTKCSESVLDSKTVGFLKAFFNQIGVICKERPIVPYHSFQL